MTVGSLFSGIGGLDLGLERAGMRIIWQCESDPFARRVLAKHWPGIPCYEDVRTIDERVKRPDMLCGGFPCQDISIAGKRAGINGERSGLWSEFARVIRLLRPQYVLVENVPGLFVCGLGRVLGDLAAIGYDAEWSMLSACAMGAPHTRERVFIVAYRPEERWRGNRLGLKRKDEIPTRYHQWQTPSFSEGWRDVEFWFKSFISPGNGSIDAGSNCRDRDGVSDRLDRIGSLGNAVVPQVAEWIGRWIMVIEGA